MKDEKPMDYIVIALCRGLAEYDANEIVSGGATSPRDENSEGYSD